MVSGGGPYGPTSQRAERNQVSASDGESPARRSQLDEQLDRLRREIERARAQIGELERKGAARETRLAETERQLNTALIENTELRKVARRTGGPSRELQRRIEQMTRQLAKLEERAERAESALRSLRTGRWWRIGVLLRTTARRPWTVLAFPVGLLGILLSKRPSVMTKPSSLPERAADVDASAEPARQAARPVVSPSPVTESRKPIPRHLVARPDVRVACIAGDALGRALDYEFEVVRIDPEDWRPAVDRDDLHLLLVAPGDPDGAWRALTAGAEEPDLPLGTLIAQCRRRGIATVLWDTGRRPRPQEANALVPEFDRIFAPGPDAASIYRRAAGDGRVSVLPPGVQQRIHNPAMRDASDLVSIAIEGPLCGGSHESCRSRAAELRELAAGLAVEARRSPSGSEAWCRPIEQLRNGGTETAYRRALVVAALNCRDDLPADRVRRRLEALACGTLVVAIGERAPGDDDLFPEGILHADDVPSAGPVLEMLLTHDALRDRLSTVALRSVLGRHTLTHRLDEILSQVDVAGPGQRPLVSAVLPTNRTEFLDTALANIARQTYRPIELVLALHGTPLPPGEAAQRARRAGLDRVTVITPDARLPLGAVMNLAFEAAAGEFLAKIDDDDYYAPHYLEDLMNAFAYTEADVVGKRERYSYVGAWDCILRLYPGEAHRYVRQVAGGTIVLRRAVLEKVRFPELRVGSDTAFLRHVRDAGFRVYAADPFNLLYLRQSNRSTHTWQVKDEKLLTMANARIEAFGYSPQHVAV